MDTTLGHVRAKEVGQHEIQVDEIRRRARQWRLMDCDEDTLEQMRHALIEEMEAVEDRLAEADKRFSIYVDEGQPLDTEQTLQSIDQLSSEWEKLNKHLKGVNNALLERQLRARLAQRLGGEQRRSQVQVEDPLPGVHRVFLGVEEHVAGAAADGVDDDVEAAEPLHGLRHGSLRVLLLGEVCRDRERLFVVFFHQAARGLHGRPRAINDDDLGAGLT